MEQQYKRKKIDFNKARLFKMLVENAPKNKIVYVLANLLVIVFQTGLIYSEEFSEIYEANISGGDKVNRTSILDKNSIFNKLTHYLDLVHLARSVNSSMLIVAILAISVVTTTTILTVLRYDILDKLSSLKHLKQLSKNKKYLFKLQAFILTNYDFIFFLLNTISFNVPLCHKVIREKRAGIQAGNFFSETTTVSFTIETDDFTAGGDKYEEVSASFVNDYITCGSPSYYLVTFCSFVILGANLFLKMISMRLMKFTPSPKMFGCRYGVSDLAFDVVLCVILAMKSVIILRLKNDYNVIRVIYLGYFIALSLVFVFITRVKPFYNHFYTKLKSFQMLYLIFLVAFSILVRETSINLFKTELSTLIIMMIAFSITYRINVNLASYNPQKICSKIKNSKKIDPQILLKIYYMTCIYIKQMLGSPYGDRAIKPEIKQIEFCLGHLIEEHKTRCRNPVCYCRDRTKVSDVLDSVPLSKKTVSYLRTLDIIFRENVFENKKQNDSLFYAYLDLLINYVGRPSYANILIKQKIKEKRLASKNREFIPVELQTFLLELKQVGLKNLENGKLPMKDHDLDENHSIELKNREKEKVSVLDHLLFLDDLEVMKDKIRSCVDVKDRFMASLKDKASLRRIFLMSYAFYELRYTIHSQFENLNLSCRRKYGPLVLVYGNFVAHVCQNRKYGFKLLTEYTKKQGMVNLNKLFCEGVHEGLEFSVVSISAEEDDFHEILYSTSNITKNLGIAFSRVISNWNEPLCAHFNLYSRLFQFFTIKN